MSYITFNNVYYLGPDGSNAENAMFKFLDVCNIKIKNKIPEKTIKSAIESILSDPDSICILPIENSIEGIVRETIDNMLKIKDETIKIQAETSIPIKHLLLSKSKDLKSIKKIISHPQAIAQCSKYLYKNFKEAEIKEVSSTSYAAQKVSLSDDKELAAIANEASAKIFNLNILSDDINDEKDNTTRFFILSKKSFDKSENGKTSLILATKNESGALANVLNIFAEYNINLTYIDSRPSKKKLGEYVFFIEFEGYETENKIKAALQKIKEHANFIKILGSYQIYK